MKLYCKCKGLTPGVTVLIPVAHGLPAPSISPALLITGVFQEEEEEKKKNPCLSHHLYSCVIVAGCRHFWLSDMAADPVRALKINHQMLQNKHGGRSRREERDAWDISQERESKKVNVSRTPGGITRKDGPNNRRTRPRRSRRGGTAPRSQTRLLSAVFLESSG